MKCRHCSARWISRMPSQSQQLFVNLHTLFGDSGAFPIRVKLSLLRICSIVCDRGSGGGVFRGCFITTGRRGERCLSVKVFGTSFATRWRFRYYLFIRVVCMYYTYIPYILHTTRHANLRRYANSIAGN